jgi:hypothetical protein
MHKYLLNRTVKIGMRPTRYTQSNSCCRLILALPSFTNFNRMAAAWFWFSPYLSMYETNRYAKSWRVYHQQLVDILRVPSLRGHFKGDSQGNSPLGIVGEI